MEHVITAPHGGIVRAVTMAAGDVVREGFPIVFIQEAEVAGGAVAAGAEARPRSHPRRSARKHRSPCADAGREPARGGGAAPQDRPPDAAREHRAAWSIPARSTNTGRWSSRASISATPSRRCARTRPATASSPACARSTAICSTRRARAPRWCITTTRCWRARRAIATTTSRTACSSWPPLPPAAGAVRRGRRRAARRGLYRPARRDRHAHLHHVFATERAGAADRRGQRPHLRRQHRAGRLQRRDHRHRGLDASAWADPR